MKIRPATEADIPAMVEIWKEFIDFHKAKDPFFSRTENAHLSWIEFVTENLSSPDWCLLVAEVNGKIVGHCMGTITAYPPVYENPRYGYVQDIAVTKQYRRKNIGTRLFEALVRWFTENQVERMELDVVHVNKEARRFWASVGFNDFMIRKWRAVPR